MINILIVIAFICGLSLSFNSHDKNKKVLNILGTILIVSSMVITLCLNIINYDNY